MTAELFDFMGLSDCAYYNLTHNVLGTGANPMFRLSSSETICYYTITSTVTSDALHVTDMQRHLDDHTFSPLIAVCFIYYSDLNWGPR